MKYEEFANPDPTKPLPSLAVICVFCGVKMRDSKSGESFGQCAKCFYRLLNEHLRSQTRARQSVFASER